MSSRKSRIKRTKTRIVPFLVFVPGLCPARPTCPTCPTCPICPICPPVECPEPTIISPTTDGEIFVISGAYKSVVLELEGGGGGGGGGAPGSQATPTTGGGGGGGGANGGYLLVQILNCTGLEMTITVVSIGTGGFRGGSPVNGQPGTDTVVTASFGTNLVTLTAGGGGGGITATSPTQGAGGTAAINIIVDPSGVAFQLANTSSPGNPGIARNNSGGQGGTGASGRGTAGGDGGFGGAAGVSVGNSGAVSFAGGNGSPFGAGGGGGGGGQSNPLGTIPPNNGGSGSDGYVKIFALA